MKRHIYIQYIIECVVQLVLSKFFSKYIRTLSGRWIWRVSHLANRTTCSVAIPSTQWLQNVIRAWLMQRKFRSGNCHKWACFSSPSCVLTPRKTCLQTPQRVVSLDAEGSCGSSGFCDWYVNHILFIQRGTSSVPCASDNGRRLVKWFAELSYSMQEEVD